MGFKQLAENIFGKQRSGDKGSVSMKSSGGNQCMNMGIPVEKISCCSNRKDARRQSSFRSADFEILADRLPGAATQFRQSFWLYKKSRNFTDYVSFKSFKPPVV